MDIEQGQIDYESLRHPTPNDIALVMAMYWQKTVGNGDVSGKTLGILLGTDRDSDASSRLNRLAENYYERKIPPEQRFERVLGIFIDHGFLALLKPIGHSKSIRETNILSPRWSDVRDILIYALSCRLNTQMVSYLKENNINLGEGKNLLDINPLVITDNEELWTSIIDADIPKPKLVRSNSKLRRGEKFFWLVARLHLGWEFAKRSDEIINLRTKIKRKPQKLPLLSDSERRACIKSTEIFKKYERALSACWYMVLNNISGVITDALLASNFMSNRSAKAIEKDFYKWRHAQEAKEKFVSSRMPDRALMAHIKRLALREYRPVERKISKNKTPRDTELAEGIYILVLDIDPFLEKMRENRVITDLANSYIRDYFPPSNYDSFDRYLECHIKAAWKALQAELEADLKLI